MYERLTCVLKNWLRSTMQAFRSTPSTLSLALLSRSISISEEWGEKSRARWGREEYTQPRCRKITGLQHPRLHAALLTVTFTIHVYNCLGSCFHTCLLVRNNRGSSSTAVYYSCVIVSSEVSITRSQAYSMQGATAILESNAGDMRKEGARSCTKLRICLSYCTCK